jgi:hypothetical protein
VCVSEIKAISVPTSPCTIKNNNEETNPFEVELEVGGWG